MISTPMKEREWVHKNHVTPNSILRNMNCKSPEMTTLIKEIRTQKSSKDLNTAQNSAHQNQFMKRRNPTLNKLFNHSNTKDEHNSIFNVQNETLDIAPADNIHGFPSYSYIFKQGIEQEEKQAANTRA